MGRLLLHADGRLRAVPLAAVTLVGRHWSCHARVNDAVLPMFWLELRWRGEAGWNWREVAERDETVGPGEVVDGAWRSMTVRGGRGARLRGPGDTWLELTDPSPPALLLTDLQTGEILDGPDAEERVELRHDGVADPRREGEPGALMRDGEVLVIEGRAWRVHLPRLPVDTSRRWVDVSAAGCMLDLDPGSLVATFTTARGSAVARGECVRVLLAYARARRDEPPEEGWLASVDAHVEWVALGGNPESVVERLSWERGKLRTALVRAGATGLDQLFERRTWRGVAEFRLALPPDAVRIARG